MDLPVNIFNHSLHQNALGGNISCAKCHTRDHTRETAKDCVECHDTMVAVAGKAKFSEMAPGYKDAMHGTCINCHVKQALKQDKADLALCPACHKADPNMVRPKLTPTKP
jgi:Zn finger protein HypA/HybF involved in hydrogenase expression